MRPVSLRFAGLRSYRHEAVVDFDRLDLFAVIGDTGAGKSTLIEALCLALYGKRSWSGGGARMEDMITDGVNTMRIEFTFRAGGHEWVVTRARHRNASAPIDRLVSTTGEAGADGAKAVTERITEVVGLDFEQFTRAVVLPQGRFDSLLRASRTERNAILTSILDLGDVTATRSRADALRREWEPRTIEWQTLRRRLPVDPDGAVDAASVRATAAIARDEQLGAAVDLATSLRREIGEVDDRRRSLRAALDALPSVPGDVEARVGEFVARWKEVDGERTAAEAARSEAQARAEAVEAEVVAARRGAASRDEVVGAARDARAVLDDAPGALGDVESAEQELARLAGEAPTPKVVPGLTTAVDEAAAALSIAEHGQHDAEAAVVAARLEWQALAAARSTLAERTAALDALDERLSHGADLIAATSAEVEAAGAAVLEAADDERNALRADAAATAAAGCAPGDDCPVCAQTLPPEFSPPVAAVAVDDARARHRSALDASADVAERLARQRAQLDKLEGERSATAALVDAARAAVEAAEASARAVGVAAQANDADSGLATVLASSANASSVVADARAAHAAALAERDQAVATRRAAVELHAHAVAGAEAQRAAAADRLARLAARLDALPGEWGTAARHLGTEELVERAAAVAAALDAAVDQLRGLDEALADAAEQARAAERRIVDLDRVLADEVRRPVDDLLAATDRYRVAVGALGAATAASGDPSCDVPSDDPASPTGPTSPTSAPIPTSAAMLASLAPALGAALRDGEQRVDAATAELSDLDSGVVDIEARLQSVVTENGCASVDDLQERRGEARRDRQSAERELDEARQDAAEVAVLDERLGIAAPLVANLTVLDVALRGQHFIAHLVDARERELLAEASRRLKDITGGRFGFVADFGIIDVRSGEVRSPDTLSGGERFQAALALALGLVEIASRGAGKLDAVFVDEGFGSLDHQALDVALQTLGAVAGGGKMVALISHLRPVAEFVDDVLLVSKDEMLGSRIELLDADAREEMLADDLRSGLMGV